MGAEAVMALMEADESEPPCVVSLDGNQVSFRHAIRKIINNWSSLVQFPKIFFKISGHSCAIDGMRRTHKSCS